MYILKNYRLYEYRSNNRHLHLQDSKLSENSSDLLHKNFQKHVEKQNSGKTESSDII